MGTRIGFVASEKGAAEEKECDVGLGLRMQTTTNTNKSLFNRKKMPSMMETTPHHHHHHHHDNHDNDDNDDEPPSILLTASGSGGGFAEEHGCDGGDSCSGPLLRNNTSSINNINNNHNLVVASMSDIYDVVGAADFGSLVMPLPPKSLLFPSSDSLMSHNSSGVVVPFTAAQRQELERQTMIYKYMMASVPVPPQLLIPISKTTPNFPHLHSNRSKGSMELGVPNGSDPEPWRCRRTDGKKWRCSRNVVPDQKYCERHSHKSRPRSRKPVEQQHQQLHSHFFHNTTNNNVNTTLLPYPKSSCFLDQREKLQSPYSSSSASHDQTRGLEWFMKGEEANSNQEWHQVVHVRPPQGRERAFDFYGEYGGGGGGGGGDNQGLQSQGLNDQISSLIDPKLVPNQTRHFIDAWSMAERLDHHNNNNKYSVVSSNDKVVPYSSLTLSMQGGNGNGNTSEESENSQMGFGIDQGDFRCQWMNNNTVSWNGSASTSPPPPGGPLAEALCLGTAGSTRSTTSSRSSS